MRGNEGVRFGETDSRQLRPAQVRLCKTSCCRQYKRSRRRNGAGVSFRQSPFAPQAAVGVVQKGLRPIIPAECPAPLADIMRQCWAKNPRDRPSFDHLKTAMEELYQVSVPL